MRLKKLLGVGISVAIVFSVMPLQVLADEISNQVRCRSIEGADYSVQENITASWDGHANIEIVFTNNGSETIDDWYYTFDFAYEIENPYNCYIVEHEGNLYTVGNNDWNQDIKPGESVTIGFTAASTDGSQVEIMPSFYLLNTKTAEFPVEAVSLEYTEYSDWTDGFSGAVLLKNNSDSAIRDWSITFSANRPITESFGSVLTINDDGTYTISNDGNTQNVAAYSSCQIGFNGGAHDASVPFEISDLSVKTRVLGLSLSDDYNGNGIPDVCETDYSGEVSVITPTPTPIPTEMPTVEPTATVTAEPTTTSIPTTTPTEVPTITETPTTTPEPTITEIPTNTPTAIPTVTIIPENLDLETDTDGDLIPDDLEPFYGTDKNNSDTDGDGIPDGYELLAGLDPIAFDTDGNGIGDGDEDNDGDGLSNIEEVVVGSNLMNPDSDLDGLTDYEEVKIYGTSPIDYDTDDDGINDYDEVQMGLNPLSTDSDGDGIPDNEEKVLQSKTVELTDAAHPAGVTSVTVEAEISGCIDENTTIKDCYYEGCVSSLIDGSIGVPVDISTSGEFDSATITFQYDSSLLGDSKEEDLVVCWIDYDNGQIIPLESALDAENCTVSAVTTHFSQYVLLDLQTYCDMWNANLIKLQEYRNNPTATNYDFVVACQLSPNTTMEERRQEWQAIFYMIQALKPGDRMTVFAYGSGTILDASGYVAEGSDWNSKIQLINLSVYDWDDGTGKSLGDLPYANMLGTTKGAAILFDYCFNDNSGNNRQLIVFTNGESNTISEETLLYPEIYGFDVNVIMVDGGADVSSLEGFYKPTGGFSYQMTDSTEPFNMPKIVYDKLDESDDDDDDDGLPNYVEDYPILTSYGFFVNTDRKEKDTDGDDCPDHWSDALIGEYSENKAELGDSIYVLTSIGYYDSLGLYFKGYGYEEFMENYGGELSKDLTCYVLRTRPDMKDTDGDYYSDFNDPKPLASGVTTIDLGGEKYTVFDNNDLFVQSSGYTQVFGSPEPGDSLAYGGNQHWYPSDDTWLLSGLILPWNYDIEDRGCGLVAYNDILLYLENGDAAYSYEDYTALLDLALTVQFRTPWGVPAPSITNAINYAGLEQGKTYEATWITYEMCGEALYLAAINDMLNRNYPVMISASVLNGEKFNYYYISSDENSSGKQFLRINNDTGTNYYLDAITWSTGHYFVITGMIYDSYANNGAGECYLRVAMGHEQERYIIYSEYCDYVDNNTSVPLQNGMMYFIG